MTDRETPPADPHNPHNPHNPADPAVTRHVEIRDESNNPVAEAEVTTAEGPEGTVRTSMHAQSGHVRPGQRASLVDAVMELPEVQGSERMEATVPYGDGESLERLRELTRDAQTRAAGSTTLLDADLPSAGGPDLPRTAAPSPAGETPADDQPAE